MSKKNPQSPKFDELFFSKTEKYINLYLPRQLNKSCHTVRSYSCGLSTFFDYISEVKLISPMKFTFTDCTYEFLLEYMRYLQEEQENSVSTVNSRIAALRSYLGYVSECNMEFTSVYLSIRRIPTLTVSKPIRPIIEPKDLEKLLNLPKKTKFGNRDRFILILLYDSAIRVGELIRITVGDVSVTDDSVSVLIHGKGRKERLIILSDKAAEHMKAYLKAYCPEITDPHAPLIYTKIHGIITPMSERNVERITKKYGDLLKNNYANIPESIYPHMFRRTRATILYRDGVPIEQISALLGHEQIETTRSHYANPSPEQLREPINRATEGEPECKEWMNHIDEMKAKFGLKQ